MFILKKFTDKTGETISRVNALRILNIARSDQDIKRTNYEFTNSKITDIFYTYCAGLLLFCK